jgi:hypothetical protein
MNNNWLKYLVALSAILIAGSAAYFSVTGLGVLFSGAAVAVMVMASSLEFAKLVTATYLKQRWDEIKGFNKWYLSFAVTILMLITSAGIFGYLSNAFQQQNLKLQQVDREIAVHTEKIKQNDSQIAQLSTQITESNTNQGKILDNGKVNSRLLRSIDNRDKQIAKLNDKISKLQDDNAKENDEINKIKTTNLDLEKEVGGFRFVAEAFGVELNSVVKFFIILIVIVFDPLAIALVIAFNQLVMITKKDDREEVDVKEVVEESAKLKLSEEDLKKLEEVLLNPPPPNEELKKAAEEYKRREELLSEMMKNDQELGLYDEPFDNPLIKKEVVPALSDEEVREMYMKEYENPGYIFEEDEEEISTIEPTEEEENENFSTIEPISENIFQEEDWTPELEEQYWEEEGKEHVPPVDEWTPELEEQFWAEQPPLPFATDVELNEMLNEVENETFSSEPTRLEIPEIKESTEPFVQLPEELDVDVQILNDTLDEVNGEIDSETSLEDEKKN